MYYQVLIQKKGENMEYYMEGDKKGIIKDVVIPYLSGDEFRVNGKIVKSTDLDKFKITETDKKISDIHRLITSGDRSGIVTIIRKESILNDSQYVKDITNNIINEVKEEGKQYKGAELSLEKSNKVFIVHGRDEALQSQVARCLEKLNLKPVILHEQASGGQTIIEKIDSFSKTVGFAVVLYTACDRGYVKDKEDQVKPRARQNVVFEHGYLTGKLGRSNVCSIVESGVETPNDISGVVYIDKEDSWDFKLARELKSAGYDIDLNNLA